ncbi:MAG: hypothetical protein GXO91_01540 [FCB group bacterium]|nr:hypothetical protein [FCB group bacterium]
MAGRRTRKARRRRDSSRHWTFWVLGIFVTVIILVFSDLGLLKLYKLKKESRQIREEIVQLKSEIDSLNGMRDQLDEDSPDFDPELIIRIAREKYGMVERGERMYRVEDQRQDKH